MDAEHTSPPLLPEDCPISSLFGEETQLGKRISEMTDEELEAYVKKVRAARESPQILRSLLSGSKRTAKAEKKPDLSILDL